MELYDFASTDATALLKVSKIYLKHMTRAETAISLKMPTGLVEKLDTLAQQKYLKRADVIIDACAYYCQVQDMNSEHLPETMRNVFFDLARHDDEFRKTLREVLRDDPIGEMNNRK
jgi:hypothetical protein